MNTDRIACAITYMESRTDSPVMTIIRVMAPIALGMIMRPIASRLQMMWLP